MSVSTFENARATLFRTFLGDEPLPTADEFNLVKRYLGSKPEFCAALDTLVSIIVQNKRTAAEGWRDRLQDYITAQLEERAASDEFADIRQQLDASVELSEEYALLYETMQAELQGAISMLEDTPTPNLGFLSEPVPTLNRVIQVSTQAPWWRRHGKSVLVGLALIFGSLLVWNFAQQAVMRSESFLLAGAPLVLLIAAFGWQWMRQHFGTRGQPYRLDGIFQSTLLLVVLVVVSVGLWTIAPSVDTWLNQDAITVTGPVQPDNSFLKQQIGLEAQLPTPLAIHHQPETTTRVREPCIDYIRGLFFRRACPL